MNRRAFFALAAGLVAACGVPLPAVTQEATPKGKPVAWRAVDPTNLVFETDDLGLVATREFDAGLAAYEDDVDWVRVDEALAKVRQSAAYRRWMSASIGEWLAAWSQLGGLGHVEPIHDPVRVVNTIDGPEDVPAITVKGLPTPAAARLGDFVRRPAGGSFYLAEKGEHRFVVAVPCHVDRATAVVTANNWGFGLVPCSIGGNWAGTAPEDAPWDWAPGAQIRLKSAIQRLDDGSWKVTPEQSLMGVYTGS